MDAESLWQIALALGAGGVLGSLLTNRREHAAWLREKRLEAFTKLIDAHDDSGNYWKNGTVEERTLAKEAIVRTTLDAQLLSPNWLRDELKELMYEAGDLCMKTDYKREDAGPYLQHLLWVLEDMRGAFGYTSQPVTLYRVKRQAKRLFRRT